MADLHKAIRTIYSNVVSVKEDAGVYTAYDSDGNEVTIDMTQVNAWVSPDQYARDRRSEYPDIGEQLDMQYWDAVNGTTTWKDAIAQVKADNPKPE